MKTGTKIWAETDSLSIEDTINQLSLNPGVSRIVSVVPLGTRIIPEMYKSPGRTITSSMLIVFEGEVVINKRMVNPQTPFGPDGFVS